METKTRLGPTPGPLPLHPRRLVAVVVLGYVVFSTVTMVIAYLTVPDLFVEFSDARRQGAPTLEDVISDLKHQWFGD